MSVDLEERMTRYALGHVTSMTREYENQRNKWIGFYNVAADAQKNACTAVENVITKAQKKHQYYAQLAMMGLSLIGGAVLAGLATVVEQNLFPLMQNTEIRLLRNKYRIPRVQLVRFADDSYTKPPNIGETASRRWSRIRSTARFRWLWRRPIPTRCRGLWVPP